MCSSDLNLYKFMRHWLASRLARERPELYHRLPFTYSLGVELDPRNKALERAVLQTVLASASVPAAES